MPSHTRGKVSFFSWRWARHQYVCFFSRPELASTVPIACTNTQGAAKFLLSVECTRWVSHEFHGTTAAFERYLYQGANGPSQRTLKLTSYENIKYFFLTHAPV